MSERKKVFFTSDAHLGSGYHADPRAVEQRLVRWLRSIEDEARAVYFLGDMFDYWFEYRASRPDERPWYRDPLLRGQPRCVVC